MCRHIMLVKFLREYRYSLKKLHKLRFVTSFDVKLSKGNIFGVKIDRK